MCVGFPALFLKILWKAERGYRMRSALVLFRDMAKMSLTVLVRWGPLTFLMSLFFIPNFRTGEERKQSLEGILVR